MKAEDPGMPEVAVPDGWRDRPEYERPRPDILAFIPDSWGPKLATTGGAVALTRAGPGEIAFKAAAHYAVVLFTPQPGRETALASDRTVTFHAPVGTFEIMPAGVEAKVRWPVAKKSALFAIEPARLVDIAAAEFDVDEVELRPPRPGTVDRQALHIAHLAQDAVLHGGALNELYVDSLITLLGLHLLRSHSSVTRVAGRQTHSQRRSTRWQPVIDYMHAHLGERISVAQLAAVVRLSPSHFLHAFRVAFDRSPHRYLLDLRLAHAERLIVETELSLAAVAEAAGFSGQSHLTTVMQNYKSTTPGQLRRLKRLPTPRRR
jgi:AraC family transcriptional regulator